MALARYVASQFAHPRGAVAPLMAALLNGVNKKVNQAAIDAARIEHGDSVIDIGFGGGVGLDLALRAAGEHGRVLAVDPSKEMVARAQRRFREEVDAGRLTATVGEAASLPFDSSAAHVAYTVNTTYFWPDVLQGLVEIRRVLRPAGRVVLAVQPSVIARHERFSGLRPASPQELASMAAEAGFKEVHVVDPVHDVTLVMAHV